MNYFMLDASALTKRYAIEAGSALLNHLFGRSARSRLCCLMLGAAEVVAALVRKRNGGVISTGALHAAVLQLQTEVVDAVDFVTLATDKSLVKAAIVLLLKHPINSSDATALQTALDHVSLHRSRGDDLILVVSDQRLLKAAQTEGLITFDPETQTQAELDQLIGP